MKLKEASTISMEVMVYAACPVAFLQPLPDGLPAILQPMEARQKQDRARMLPGLLQGLQT